MANLKNRTSLFIVWTGLIIAVGRVLLGSDAITGDGQNLLIIMAIVNYVAFGFVLLFLYNGFADTCKQKVIQSGLETKIKKKCGWVMNIISGSMVLLYGLVGIMYTLFWKSADLNDAISIFALAISIATNGLVEDYSIKYYELVKWCAKRMG